MLCRKIMDIVSVCILVLTLLLANSKSCQGMPSAYSEGHLRTPSDNGLDSVAAPINKREIQIETGSIQIGAKEGLNSTAVRIVYGQPAVSKSPQPDKPSWRQRRYSDLMSSMERKSREENILTTKDDGDEGLEELDQEVSNYIPEFEKLVKRVTSKSPMDSFMAMRGKKLYDVHLMADDLDDVTDVPEMLKASYRAKRRQPDTFWAMRGRKRRSWTAYKPNNKGNIGNIFIGMRG